MKRISFDSSLLAKFKLVMVSDQQFTPKGEGQGLLSKVTATTVHQSDLQNMRTKHSFGSLLFDGHEKPSEMRLSLDVPERKTEHGNTRAVAL